MAAGSMASSRVGAGLSAPESPQKASSTPITAAAFGSRWIPCAIANSSKSSGPRARLPGRCGDAQHSFLGRPAGAAHRPNGF